MEGRDHYKAMAGVSPLAVPQSLTAFFANMACDVFDEFRTLNAAPNEARVKDELVTPLQWLLCGGEPAAVFGSLEEHQGQANFCGKVFRSGEPAYFCKDCQTDPTCCLCMECFEHSEHKNHHYRLFASGGGGCCDCGDPEAWTSFVHCDIHKPGDQDEPEVDPVEGLPVSLADRARPFFSALLWYCMDLLCWEESHSLPHTLKQGRTAECLTQPNFLCFLYNDENHSYDEVIFTLTSNLRKSHTDAVALATYVDRKGRAVAATGTEEECKESAELINKELASREPLKVMVFHAAVAAHQTNAVLCLSLLKELAEKLDAFRRLISEALVQVRGPSNCCILDRFFLNDSKMWITARLGWHRLVMSSIFMDPKWKPQLATNLTKNYTQLQKNFVDDSHNHDVCASNVTVQLFTVPSLCHMLVAHHGLLKTIVNTLIELVSPCKDHNTGVLKLSSSTYKHARISYIMFDLRYVLRNKPEDLSQMREPVLEAFRLFLGLLDMLQNAGEVKRQYGQHVRQEQTWESIFNFFIILHQPLLLFINWCTSDRILLCEAVKMTLRKHQEVAKRPKLLYRRHEVSRMLAGVDKMSLYVFDIQKDAVSVHQPLARVLAGLLTGASFHNMNFTDLLQIQTTDVQTPLFLLEFSSRVLVMAVQVLAGMWKRNGYSVFQQVVTYQYNYPREMMYDKDIVMLQTMAAILDPSVFLYALIYKFRLDSWLSRPGSDPSAARGESPDDALRFFLSEAEEFVFLLITIFCERFGRGIGEGVTEADTLRREIVHKLFIAPLPHSHIMKEFRMTENENAIDQLLKQVATLRKGSGMSRSVFVLKAEYEEEYSPFFYHYTKTDHSKAEEARRKKAKSTGLPNVQAPSPKKLPQFCMPFLGVLRLTCCPVLHRILCCVFRQAANPDCKFWSDRLLHEALYLCAVMLREEDSTKPHSLCNAAIGSFGDHQFLSALSTLLASRRAEEHRPLLVWIVQLLKKHRKESTGHHSPPSSSPSSSLSSSEPPKLAESERPQEERMRKELAKERREKVMAQMQSMQRRFLEKNREQMEGVEGEERGKDEVDGTVPQPSILSPTVQAVGVETLLSHTPEQRDVTCILCQAEEKEFTKVIVQAVHVQRSCVMSRGKRRSEEEEEGRSEAAPDLLAAHAGHAVGMFTSGCGHQIHAECWRRFIDLKQQEHSRNHFFPLPGQSVRWSSGEFLCPLCQSFSNTVLPLLPPLSPSPSSVPAVLPAGEVGYSEWRDVVQLALELGEGGEEALRDASAPTALWEKLQEMFGPVRRPSTYYQKSDNDMKSVLEIFTQSVYMRAYKTDPDEANERVCLAEWNNCAYTISSLQMTSKQGGKFLLDTLSSRQVDYIGSLVKMGCDPSVRPRLRQLSGHVRQLINSFLLESPPFGELLSIVEIDAFFMMVYLHFAVVSLLVAIVSPSGHLIDSPLLPALTGATMLHVVRTATTASVVQGLLCTPPGMETEERGASVAVTSCDGDGEALQKLWMKFRRQAGLPCDCPPEPSSLLSGVWVHLEPFLHCAVLFCQSFTGVSFIRPEEDDSLFPEMCKFLNIPTQLHTLFEVTGETKQHSIPALASLWCAHPRLQEVLGGTTLPALLQQPRSVVSLPEEYTELVNRASRFQCPKHVADGGDGQAAMLCLLCGKMLCTNSYCCMYDLEGEEGGGQAGKKPLRIGGLTHHSQSCSGGLAMALWILEAYVVLLDATDLYHVKGCTLTPPYLDEYGEPDPGLRRGHPLRLHKESMQSLAQIWHQHGIPKQIAQEMESNRGLMQITWSRM